MFHFPRGTWIILGAPIENHWGFLGCVVARCQVPGSISFFPQLEVFQEILLHIIRSLCIYCTLAVLLCRQSLIHQSWNKALPLLTTHTHTHTQSPSLGSALQRL